MKCVWWLHKTVLRPHLSLMRYTLTSLQTTRCCGQVSPWQPSVWCSFLEDILSAGGGWHLLEEPRTGHWDVKSDSASEVTSRRIRVVLVRTHSQTHSRRPTRGEFFEAWSRSESRSVKPTDSFWPIRSHAAQLGMPAMSADFVSHAHWLISGECWGGGSGSCFVGDSNCVPQCDPFITVKQSLSGMPGALGWPTNYFFKNQQLYAEACLTQRDVTKRDLDNCKQIPMSD